MKTVSHPIDVRRYDAVVEVLLRNPGISFGEAARRAGVSEPTVRRIWEGSLSRPPIVVLERLESPRRCRECGALCRDWPCVPCEIQRREPAGRVGRRTTQFVYRRQKR